MQNTRINTQYIYIKSHNRINNNANKINTTKKETSQYIYITNIILTTQKNNKTQ